MAPEEEPHVTLTRRIDRIESAVEQVANTVGEVVSEMRAERRRQRFEPSKVLTVSAAVLAVACSGGGFLMQVYVEPIKVRAAAHDAQLMRGFDWMMEAQYRLGSHESRLQDLAKQ